MEEVDVDDEATTDASLKSESEEKKQMNELQKKLEKTERLLDKTQKYNEELRKQVETLSEQLHAYRNCRSGVNQETQTFEQDFVAAKENLASDWLTETKTENMSLADCVKAVAEEALQQTSFVYDETSGLYFDSASGYYYDPATALYYNSATGTYYTYDQNLQTYIYHSQLDMSDMPKEKSNRRKKSSKKRKKNSKEERSHRSKRSRSKDARKRRTHTHAANGDSSNDDVYDDSGSFEDGECSDSSDESDSVASASIYGGGEDVYKYPPCIRCMVEESQVESLPIGTLHIVTCSGAMIGREKTNDICIQDIQISKFHAHITYYSQQRFYTITDLGSQNGTSVNNLRIAEPKQTSEPYPLKHEDLLEVGNVKLRLHIHPGTDTCDQCEPGQVQAVLSTGQSKPQVDILSRAEKEQQRRRELKQIRKKFGLENSDFEDPAISLAKSDPSYSDRARQRRKTKGVDNPYGKTESASVDVAIAQNNKGRKMLEKMGWADGTSLGKSQSGIVEPISVELRPTKAGLGSHGHGVVTAAAPALISAAKQDAWRKTRQRYDEIFGEEGSNNTNNSKATHLKERNSECE